MVYIKQFRVYQLFLGGCLFLLYATCMLWILVMKNRVSSVKTEVKETTDTVVKPYSHYKSVATKTISLHKKVLQQGTLPHQQFLTGSTFDSRGIYQNITASITSMLLFSFSPKAEELFSKKLVDPNHEQLVYANSPAMIWNGDRFIVVMRMWLDKEQTYTRTRNVFSDNYFYMRMYTENMEPLDKTGRLLGIPTRVHEALGMVLITH